MLPCDPPGALRAPQVSVTNACQRGVLNIDSKFDPAETDVRCIVDAPFDAFGRPGNCSAATVANMTKSGVFRS
jgi:hypothetical protein